MTDPRSNKQLTGPEIDAVYRLTGNRPVRCPDCDHGIDPHGVDPGGPCGVGDLSGNKCGCKMSPNGIASELLKHWGNLINTALGVKPGDGPCTLESAVDRIADLRKAAVPTSVRVALDRRTWVLCDRDYEELLRLDEPTDLAKRAGYCRVGMVVTEGQRIPDVRYAYPLLGSRAENVFVLVTTEIDAVEGVHGATRVLWTFESLAKIQGDFVRGLAKEV